MKKSFKKTLLSGLFISTLFLEANAMAADYRQNPFTLTYDGAITENVQGKVNIQPVKYQLNGLTIAANVYTPANFDPNKKYPAIVVAHPNGGVKEQVAGLYAQKLAEQGYITIAFDAAYQGGSGGEPRYVDKPANRIEDIRGAADFISQFKGVDANRIGLLGICGGGGYSIKAAETDKRFKSVATISMFNSGDARRNGFMRSQTNNIQERLKQASDARAQEAAGGEILYAGFPRALNGLLTLQNVLKERSEKGIQDPQGNPPTQAEPSDYYALGTHTLNTLNGRDNSAVLWNFDGVDYALKAHLFGYLFSRDNLSAVNRELVTISTLASLETVQNQLRSHLGILKNLGLNETELKRVMDQIRQQNPTAADKAESVLKDVFKAQ